MFQTIIKSRHGFIMKILHNLKLGEKVEIERKKIIQLSFDLLQDKALVVKAIIILSNNF